MPNPNGSNTSTSSLNSWTLVNLVAFCVVNGFFAFTGIFLNSLVILSFMKSNQLRKKVCYILILVLACADLIAVTVIHPLLTSSVINKLLKKDYGISPYINGNVVHIFCGISLFVLFAMNIERYLAIVHPFFHQLYVTRAKLLILVVIFSLFLLAEWLLGYVKVIPEGPLVLVITGVLFLLILRINYKIFGIAKQKQVKDAAQERNSRWRDQGCIRRNNLANFKTVSTCNLVCVTFFLCVSPIVVNTALYTFQKDSMREEAFLHFTLWTQTILTMNSTFNCMIFFWKNKSLRHEGKKVLKCCAPHSNH